MNHTDVKSVVQECGTFIILNTVHRFEINGKMNKTILIT